MAEAKKVSDKQITIFNKNAPGLLAVVEKFEIVSDDKRAEIIEIGKGYQANVKTVDEYFKDDIKRAGDLHTSLTGKRKVLRDLYSGAITAIKAKIGLYDKKVLDEKIALDLKKQAEEQAKRDRALKAAEKKIAGLLEGVKDIGQQRDILIVRLETGEVTDEEAILMRAQIVVLEEAIESKQEKADLTVAKVEQAAPISAPVSSAPKPTGYDAEIINPIALCRDIAEGKAPASLVKFDIVNIKRDRKRDIVYSGVRYVPLYAKKRL